MKKTTRLVVAIFVSIGSVLLRLWGWVYDRAVLEVENKERLPMRRQVAQLAIVVVFAVCSAVLGIPGDGRTEHSRHTHCHFSGR